ncbi:hypothetical protein KEM52_004095, partial [Ascosphaera acerosa]
PRGARRGRHGGRAGLPQRAPELQHRPQPGARAAQLVHAARAARAARPAQLLLPAGGVGAEPRAPRQAVRRLPARRARSGLHLRAGVRPSEAVRDVPARGAGRAARPDRRGRHDELGRVRLRLARPVEHRRHARLHQLQPRQGVAAALTQGLDRHPRHCRGGGVPQYLLGGGPAGARAAGLHHPAEERQGRAGQWRHPHEGRRLRRRAGRAHARRPAHARPGRGPPGARRLRHRHAHLHQRHHRPAQARHHELAEAVPRRRLRAHVDGREGLGSHLL